MIKILILILILIIIIYLVSIYKESFNDKNIIYLKTSNVCSILKNLNYNYNSLDVKLRDIPFEYHNDIYKFYCDHLLDFTELDKTLLGWVIDDMKSKLPKNLLFIFDTIKFAKFRNNVDNGYPHTNYDVIFITESFISDLLGYYNNNDINGAIENIGAVIIHECVHVLQRKHPKSFNELYTKYWKFIKVNKIHNSAELNKRIRYNPDGPDTNWIFSFKGKHIYILSIYDEDAANIGHVKMIGVYVEKNNENCIIPNDAEIMPLNSINEFTEYFEHLYGNHYHPNEISAELLSIYYLKAMKISHFSYTNIGYRNMLVWLNKFLKL
jgi:hypothetical protein